MKRCFTCKYFMLRSEQQDIDGNFIEWTCIRQNSQFYRDIGKKLITEQDIASHCQFYAERQDQSQHYPLTQQKIALNIDAILKMF